MRCSSVVPRARCVSSRSFAVPASAYPRACPLWHSDTLRDASLSVWRSFPHAHLWSAVDGPGRAARRGAVLAAQQNLRADVPGAAAAARCRAAGPAPAADVAGVPCVGTAGVSVVTRSVRCVDAICAGGGGVRVRPAGALSHTLHQRSL